MSCPYIPVSNDGRMTPEEMLQGIRAGIDMENIEIIRMSFDALDSWMSTGGTLPLQWVDFRGDRN